MDIQKNPKMFDAEFTRQAQPKLPLRVASNFFGSRARERRHHDKVLAKKELH